MSEETLQQPRLYPSFASVGVSDEFIIEYDEELVRNALITLEVVEEHSHTLVQRVSGTEIGPKVVKAKLDEFTVPGTYTVITKFSNLEDDRFPRITLRVLSTLEVICLRSQMKDHDKGPVLAAALAYLIQCDMAGEHDTPEQLTDDALLNVLQSVSKVPLLSLPAFLCGKYFSGHEGLLHFAIRHRLDTTCQFLLSPELGGKLKGFLDVQGYDKKTARELAFDMNMESIMTTIGDTNVHDTSSERGSPKDSPRQATKHKHKKGMKDVLKSKGTQMMSASKKHYFRLKTAIKTHNKSNDSDDEASSKTLDTTEESAALSEVTEEQPALPIAEEQPVSSIAEFKEQAQLYRATVDYECFSKENGTATVKAGEIVHVINVEDSGMCLVIIRNDVKSLPISCLEKVPEEELDDYEDMEEFGYLKVIEGDQGVQQQNPERIQYYAQTTLAESMSLEKSKRAAKRKETKAQKKEEDKEEYYYVETMRPPQPLPVAYTADDSDDDAYEAFSPPSQETLASLYPERHSMYINTDTQLPASTSLDPPAIPPRRSSDRGTPPPLFSHPTHEGAYVNQRRRSSGTPDSYPTSPLLSPVHSTPDASPRTKPRNSLPNDHEGPDTLPRTSSIRPDSTIMLDTSNPIPNRNSKIFTYSHQETPPLIHPRTVTPPHHFPRTSTHTQANPTTPPKPPVAPKPKPRIAPKPVDRH